MSNTTVKSSTHLQSERRQLHTRRESVCRGGGGTVAEDRRLAESHRITSEWIGPGGVTSAHGPAPERRIPLSELGKASKKERREVLAAILISIVVLGGGIFYAGCDPSMVI